MDVEQTLKVLEFGRDLSMKAAGIWRWYSAATTAEYLNQADACSHAIAIIKAAKAVAEDASVAMRKEGGTPQFYGVGRVAMERLLSLLSPEQEQKKDA